MSKKEKKMRKKRKKIYHQYWKKKKQRKSSRMFSIAIYKKLDKIKRNFLQSRQKQLKAQINKRKKKLESHRNSKI